MITPEKLSLNRQKYLEDFALDLLSSYSQKLTTQVPDKDGFYLVDSWSSPPLTEQETEQIHKILCQSFAASGWQYMRTPHIFSYKLRSSK